MLVSGFNAKAIEQPRFATTFLTSYLLRRGTRSTNGSGNRPNCYWTKVDPEGCICMLADFSGSTGTFWQRFSPRLLPTLSLSPNSHWSKLVLIYMFPWRKTGILVINLMQFMQIIAWRVTCKPLLSIWLLSL